jgi:hypothetical protein
MMAPSTAGLMCGHSTRSFVTVTKSWPRKTPETPSTAKTRSASGDTRASSAVRKSRVPFGRTVRPGMNFSVAGFGVSSVWMNIVSVLCSRPQASCDSVLERF